MQPIMIWEIHGVRNRGCTVPKRRGETSPSRAMASMTRGWLSMSTSKTDVMPTTAPIETTKCAQGSPTCLKASATGASMLILSYGTMPVRTAAIAM